MKATYLSYKQSWLVAMSCGIEIDLLVEDAFGKFIRLLEES